MIYEKILDESRRLEQQIDLLQSQLQSFPEGKLICSLNGSRIKWRCSDGHNSIYIPKENRQFAEQLAHKKYLSLQLKNMAQEKKAIDFYLRHHDSNALQTEAEFLNSPGYKELLSPIFTPLSQELQDWLNEPYERNTKHPENLTIEAHSGNYVRSKSEMLIDMFLFKNNIPFRYECPLELGDIIIYPDFTIRHPKTGQLFYWENFGMMDNPNYSKHVLNKLQLYISNGIIPSIQLITTFETKKSPLTAENVERTVQQYFL